jgi:hypothetical protein
MCRQNDVACDRNLLVREDGMVAGVRGVIPSSRTANAVGRIVEPELDMQRLGRKQQVALNVLRELLRRLVPAGERAVRSPMRSIAREIEEAWPSDEL